ncbi:hypothetical protein [Arthrobacter rhizosphaerae]|uniref:hypothetical protein n=1 Tax=Arthrobacter rhizosphaerae TaxID=2855490 RepID=UPI001FF333ED|nr:hypothetical protein [Arthrobacter rhizosphaerae]
MGTIYETRESFPVPLTSAEALQILVQNLKAEGYRPRHESIGVTVCTGWNFFVRMWGTMLPWGRRSVPVGMTVNFEETTTGSIAKGHAYDRLGWYLDAETNPVFKEEWHRKMEQFTELARKALTTQA